MAGNELNGLDVLKAQTMVSHELESQLKAAAAKRDAHQLLFSECMRDDMNLPFFRQAGAQDKAVCEEVADKLTPKFLEDREKQAKLANNPVGEKSTIERMKDEGVMPVLSDIYNSLSLQAINWIHPPEPFEFPDKK